MTLRGHIAPRLGHIAIAEIRPGQVRHRCKQLLDAGSSAVTVAKAHRLLKAVLNTVADDGVIRRNPCRKERWTGRVTRAADPDNRPGLRPGRRDRPAIPCARVAGDVHQPPLERVGRSATVRHRSGGVHRTPADVLTRLCTRRSSTWNNNRQLLLVARHPHADRRVLAEVLGQLKTRLAASDSRPYAAVLALAGRAEIDPEEIWVLAMLRGASARMRRGLRRRIAERHSTVGPPIGN